MDVSRAQVLNLRDCVQITDPEFPWSVRVRISPDSDRPEIIELSVFRPDRDDAPGLPITSAALAQIPVRQIASVAASTLRGQGGEQLMRMLAQPRPKGARSWPADHFRRVDRVAAWARSTGRPGGAAGAVAEFWDVHYRTARRWLSHRS